MLDYPIDRWKFGEICDMELRPIGTEFEVIYSPDKYSTDVTTKIVVYRVMNHVNVIRYKGDKKGELAEEIQVVSIKYEHEEMKWKQTD